jgi:hypothetical protein
LEIRMVAGRKRQRAPSAAETPAGEKIIAIRPKPALTRTTPHYRRLVVAKCERALDPLRVQLPTTTVTARAQPAYWQPW